MCLLVDPCRRECFLCQCLARCYCQLYQNFANVAVTGSKEIQRFLVGMAPSVDQSSLDLLLQSNLSWCQLGAYETISKSQAADGKCLAEHHLLLKALLDLQPAGQLLLTQVRSSVLKVCSLKPDVNQSQLKNLLWAGSRYDKLCCMLYHVRRAKRDPEKMRQLVAKTVAEDLAKVMELVNKLEDEPKAGDAQEASDNTPPRRIIGKTSPQKIRSSPSFGSSSKASAVKPKPAKAKAKPGVSKPAKPDKAAAKSQEPVVQYRKDYYKNGNSYGFKEFVDKKYINQIFSIGGKYQSKTFLDVLSAKVLADLNNRACGDASKEQEIELVARYKCWKQSQGST